MNIFYKLKFYILPNIMKSLRGCSMLQGQEQEKNKEQEQEPDEGVYDLYRSEAGTREGAGAGAGAGGGA